MGQRPTDQKSLDLYLVLEKKILPTPRSLSRFNRSYLDAQLREVDSQSVNIWNWALLSFVLIVMLMTVSFSHICYSLVFLVWRRKLSSFPL